MRDDVRILFVEALLGRSPRVESAEQRNGGSAPTPFPAACSCTWPGCGLVNCARAGGGKGFRSGYFTPFAQIVEADTGRSSGHNEAPLDQRIPSKQVEVIKFTLTAR